MTILSSSIIDVNSQQVDGRRLIIERHKTFAGDEYIYSYTAEVGVDVNQVLADRAAYLEAEIPNWENGSNDGEA